MLAGDGKKGDEAQEGEREMNRKGENRGKGSVAGRRTRVDGVVERGGADRDAGRSGPALNLVDIEVSLFCIRKLSRP